MRHAAERGRALTGQLLAFSRRQHLSPEALDVNALIGGFEPLMRRAVGESVTLEVALPGRTASVCDVDPTQLETALLNLAVNARDAMPDGGTPDDRRSPRRSRRRSWRAVTPRRRRGPWIVIAVRDTGTGMPQAVPERVFEPFFTTKEVGKG